MPHFANRSREKYCCCEDQSAMPRSAAVPWWVRCCYYESRSATRHPENRWSMAEKVIALVMAKDGKALEAAAKGAGMNFLLWTLPLEIERMRPVLRWPGA